jgi:phosphatidylinositol alpha-mannosyltransferase
VTTAPERVVFVSLMPGLGGPARSLLGLLRGLEGRTERVVAVPPGALRTLLVEKRAADRVIALPAFSQLGRLRRAVQSLALARAWSDLPPKQTVLHCNGHTELAIALPLVVAGAPTVAHMRSLQPSGWMARSEVFWRFVPRSVQWIAVSPMAEECLLRLGAATAGTITQIPNPIDLDDVVGHRKRPADGRLTVGYFGSRRSIKGYRLLPQVAAHLKGKGIRLRLYVKDDVSENPLANNATTAELRGLGDVVEFVGHQADLRGEYASCDVVLAPSLEESFGRVPLEAMANGVPVIASDIPAYRRFADAGAAMTLFKSGDAAAAAAAIIALADDAGMRGALAARGPSFADDYAPAAVASRVVDVYATALRVPR